MKFIYKSPTEATEVNVKCGLNLSYFHFSCLKSERIPLEGQNIYSRLIEFSISN